MTHLIKPWDDGKRKAVSLEDALKEISALPKPKEDGTEAESPETEAHPQREQTNPPGEGMIAVPYQDLEWQLKAYREPGKTDKALLLFDASQEKRVQEGYESHPSSAEAFAFICAYLDDQKNKTALLTPEQAEVVKDMLTSYGEFFCQAIETTQTKKSAVSGLFPTQNTVTIYELVRALPRNAANNGYEKAGMKYSGTPKTFNVSDLELGKYHYFKNIHDQHDDLIEYLTSRKYEDLPDEIKENGGIGLPSPGAVWPVGRGGFSYGFGIYGFDDRWASRGVRRAKKSP